MKEIIMTLLVLSFALGVYAANDDEMVSLGEEKPSFAKENWGEETVCRLTNAEGLFKGMILYYFPESESIFTETNLLEERIVAFLKTKSGENTLLGWSDERIHKITVQKDKRLFSEMDKQAFKNYLFMLMVRSGLEPKNVWDYILAESQEAEKSGKGRYLNETISLENYWSFLSEDRIKKFISLVNTKLKLLEENKDHLIFAMTKKGQSEAVHLKCVLSGGLF